MVALLPHPASPPLNADIELIASLDVLSGRVLRVGFEIGGAWQQLRIPARTSPQRVDGLWQHTCCEVFIGGAAAAGYVEFNCAPSGEWAAYQFSGYRAGACTLAALKRLPIATAIADARFRLEADLDLACLPPALAPPYALGLGAVLEAADGALSYWALAHPAERPDFHDRRSFVFDLRG
jgi:hypothetical protein